MALFENEAFTSDVGTKDKPKIADNLFIFKLMLVFDSFVFEA